MDDYERGLEDGDRDADFGLNPRTISGESAKYQQGYLAAFGIKEGLSSDELPAYHQHDDFYGDYERF